MDETRARENFERAMASYEQDFGRFFLARLLDLSITYPGESCRVAFEIRDFMFNPQGTLHGGVAATVLDISMGHLLRHRNGVAGVTLEMKIQYMRPLPEGPAVAEACFLKPGRSAAFLESRLFDARGKLAAMASATFQLLSPAAPQA